jgi:hypothetical protein
MSTQNKNKILLNKQKNYFFIGFNKNCILGDLNNNTRKYSTIANVANNPNILTLPFISNGSVIT